MISLSNRLNTRASHPSIKNKPIPPFFLFLPLQLLIFVEDGLADYQTVHPGAHKTAIGIFRRAYNRFAPDIETGVDQDRTAGSDLEG